MHKYINIDNKLYRKNEYRLANNISLIRIICCISCISIVYTIFINFMRRATLRNWIHHNNCENQDIVEELNHDTQTKKILITGSNSYLGTNVERWLNKDSERYKVVTLDMIDERWKNHDFSNYDVVFHVAGIAHADVGKVSKEEKQLYYKVNTELAFEAAKKAKNDGVKQFIFMSSIIIYAGCNEKIITGDTKPNPLDFYGDSKWRAEEKIGGLSDNSFKIVIIRSPMIYGKGSKGNYFRLSKLAEKLPVFPIVKNKRSMLHIDNLCQFVKLMIDNQENGVFFPQNGDYVNTSDMVQMIANVKNNKIIMLPFCSILISLMEKIPGRTGGLMTKVFGDFVYEMELSEYKTDYRVCSLYESIFLTEGGIFNE